MVLIYYNIIGAHIREMDNSFKENYSFFFFNVLEMHVFKSINQLFAIFYYFNKSVPYSIS